MDNQAYFPLSVWLSLRSLIVVCHRGCEFMATQTDINMISQSILLVAQVISFDDHILRCLYVGIHVDTSTAWRSHPSSCPQDLHILSTTRIFSSRPNLGSSKSPMSSENPSLSRLLDGIHVSTYSRRDDAESSNKPMVSGGISPFVSSALWCPSLA